ncbi:MAG: hypothetical protein K8W52_12575 [Deltaproteobacteria bacterium]|nr:hypothetical protein [Deltaproteobacteria bacterium]
MSRLAITPRAFHPAVTIDRHARLAAVRDTLSAAGDPFGSGLELWALASDVAGKPLAAAAGVPAAWQARLIARIARARRHHRGPRRLRFDAAAATVLLDLFEGARGDGAIARAAMLGYRAILDGTPACRLRESMVVNLDRVRHLLDGEGRAALAEAWRQIAPETPPYAHWFAGERREVRLVCQVQDVFFRAWKGFMKKLGFAIASQSSPGRIHYRRTDVVRGIETTFHVDYRKKGEGIFQAMADDDVDGVLFLGHSDWWARVPRNLADAPDQRGAKLLVLLMCFGKHFHHALHERYPDAHIVTTKDPTEDPEDVAMLRHLFDGIAARATWKAIRKAVVADAKTADNFVFPGDIRYIVGVSDDDRDGRLDRFDRFCNVASGALLSPANLEDSFVPDPPGLHPRGVELAPRELDGANILEAALMLNSLSYDNQLLDQVNLEQKVVASGWHVPRPGDFRAARFRVARRDGAEIVRLSCSIRYARAAPSALTAMVVYEGYQFLAKRLRSRPALDAVDHALMGLMLVGHALANANYPQHEACFRAFVRRYGFPARLPLARVLHHIEADPDWESGSRRAVRALRRELTDPQLARLERVLDA